MEKPIVTSPYVKEHFYIKTDEELVSFVKKLEKTTGLRFMARKKGDTLHGFCTKVGGYIIVSIYSRNKSPDKESPHYFRAPRLTYHLKQKILKLIDRD